ncbi:1-phosphofructokinase family hexose kinase [Rhodovulum sp. YNF3179]|uniref:1-phosphofructokinase family hexose kinase n=1 Tax=Rhodovulum sp. YNF3179 TaxID=3425127 RepID=UPI003D35848D
MPRILTITLNPTVDFASDAHIVRPTRKIRTSPVATYPGGGGVNVARVIRALGGETEAVILAGGEIGTLLKRLLEERGVPSHRIDIEGQTRIGFDVKETYTGLEYRFVPEGPEVTDAELQAVLDHVVADDSAWVVASGSLPAGAPRDFYARIAEAAEARGARFVLDSSGPGLAATLEAADVYLAKPNLRELGELVGRELTSDEAGAAAAELVRHHNLTYAAITLGEDGGVLAGPEGVLRLPALTVRLRSAVGAGDSFLAAMTWGLSEGRPVEDAFRLGMAAGTAALLTRGTQLCRREDVFALYERMAAL